MNIAIIKLITITFLAGSIYTILGILIDNMLYRVGIARKMTRPSIISAYFWAFIKVFAYTEMSWLVTTLIYVLGTVFYKHRKDLWATRAHGRWWWKSEDENTNSY